MLDKIKFTIAELIYKPNFLRKVEILKILDKQGIYVLQNFISSERADELAYKIEKCFEANPDLVKKESNGFDERIYGADLFTDFEFVEFNEITEYYAKKFYFSRKLNSFSLLGRIHSGIGNLGSGSGWHRDSPITHQFKGIVYLTDVDEANGPFQYIEESHKLININKVLGRLKVESTKRRFTDLEVDNLISEGIIPSYKSYLGKKGTLILVNTRGLHRGAPITNGSRTAITRYFSTKSFKDDFFKK